MHRSYPLLNPARTEVKETLAVVRDAARFRVVQGQRETQGYTARRRFRWDARGVPSLTVFQRRLRTDSPWRGGALQLGESCGREYVAVSGLRWGCGPRDRAHLKLRAAHSGVHPAPPGRRGPAS